MTRLGELLNLVEDRVRVTDPAATKLISVKLHGKGAVQRTIGDGKSPKPFIGNRGRAGQFVFSRIWARRGAMALIPDELDGVIVTNEFPLFDIDNSLLDSRFLKYLVQTPRFHAELERISAGASGQNRVKEAAFLALEVDIPPVEEQRRIAAILEAADAIRSRRNEILARFDVLTTAVFHSAFADYESVVPLSDMVEEFRYGTSNKAGDGGHPTLRIPNVVGGALSTEDIKTVNVTPSELNRLTLRDGDLLFVRTNGNIHNVGRSAVFSSTEVGDAGFGDRPWIYASYLIRARLHRGYDPKFVAAYLQTGPGRAQLRERSKTSAGQFNINTESLGSIVIPAAPLAEQQAFAAHVARIDAQRATVQRALAADNELFASLQSRAFSGML